jgi:hypothetical protein
MESIAVVKRRGADFWPCTRGFGGPVCRVGGKLHRALSRIMPGSQSGEFELCRQYVWVLYGDGPLVVPSRCFGPPRG